MTEWDGGPPLEGRLDVLPARTREDRICRTKGCQKQVYARGWCKSHYEKAFRRGEFEPYDYRPDRAGRSPRPRPAQATRPVPELRRPGRVGDLRDMQRAPQSPPVRSPARGREDLPGSKLLAARLRTQPMSAALHANIQIYPDGLAGAHGAGGTPGKTARRLRVQVHTQCTLDPGAQIWPASRRGRGRSAVRLGGAAPPGRGPRESG